MGSIPWELAFRIYEATQPAGQLDLGFSNVSSADGTGADLQIVTLVKMLKTPKLLRVGRMFKFLERIEGAANVGRIVLLVLLTGFIVHSISCVWYVVASGDGGYLDDAGLRNLRWYDQYLDNYYTTLMMVMGDSTSPITKLEKWFASTIVLTGACLNATIFANVASYVAQIGATNAQHKSRIESIVRATRLLKVPEMTAHRIRAYFDYCWLRHMDFAGQNLVNELPQMLRRAVSFQTHERKLRSLGIFAHVDERFLAALATHLRPEVYLPDEFILILGQISSCAYFVERGRVNILWRTDSKHAPRFVVRSDYFGELGLFQSKQHLYSARAMTHCDTYSLYRSDFESVLQQHPTVAIEIADMLPTMLSKPAARLAIESIYNMVGISSLLSIFHHGKWRPLRGLAQKIRNLHDDDDFMRRMPQPWHSPRRGSVYPRALKGRNSKDDVHEGSNDEISPADAPGGASHDVGTRDRSPPEIDSVERLGRDSSPGAASPLETPPSPPMSLAQLTQAHTSLSRHVHQLATSQRRVETLVAAIASKLGVSDGGDSS